MHTFFYYAAMVNYGTEIYDATTIDNHIRIDDSVWEYNGTLFDCCFGAHIGCWMNERSELGIS